MPSNLKIIALSTLIGAFLFLISPFWLGFRTAAENNNNFEEICSSQNIEQSEAGLSREEYRKLLEDCSDYYNQKSVQIEKEIEKTGQEKKNLANKISTLQNKIKNLDYKIYQSNLMIKDLTLQIGSASLSIEKTSDEIEKIKDNLSGLLRLRYEEDQKSAIEILLTEDTLSDFVDNLVALEALSDQTKELLKNIKGLKTDLEEQKTSMDNEKKDLESVLSVQILQKQESASAKKEVESLLKLTEAEYEKQVQTKKETQEIASQIKARIFELIGVPEAPTFGEALEIAKYVEKMTGVRPAFLLAVLTQESNIGKNVGQCYLPRDPSENTKKRIMAPGLPASKRDDVSFFLEITKGLGRDPYNTPVSCPMAYGWGGAMGPAQFIPSTWNIYKSRLQEITGRLADPWNIKDAFLAAGLYLANYGAGNKTYNSEWKAAMIYFSGTSARTRYNGYGFYGDSVMGLAEGYSRDIQAIE